MTFVLGNWLHDHGYSQCVYIRSVDRRLGFSQWNWQAAYIPFAGSATTASFVSRYGHQPSGIKGDGHDPSQAGIELGLFEAGSTAGERGLTAADRLRAAMQLPSQPFGVALPGSDWIDPQAVQDCLYVRDLQEPTKSFFDGWLERTLNPSVAPQPVHPIAKPPAQPPIIPPSQPVVLTALARLSDRVIELENIARPFLTGLAPAGWFQPAQLNSGVQALLVASRPFTTPLLAQWRRCRQALGDMRPLPLVLLACIAGRLGSGR